MILLDSSGILAAILPGQRHHAACARVLNESGSPFLVSPFVLAEVDYLLTRFGGIDAEMEFLREIECEAYDLAAFGAPEIGAARELIAQYRDLGIGLADASIIVLARTLGVRDVITLDERPFRSIPGPGGHPLRLLPADAEEIDHGR